MKNNHLCFYFCYLFCFWGIAVLIQFRHEKCRLFFSSSARGKKFLLYLFLSVYPHCLQKYCLETRSADERNHLLYLFSVRQSDFFLVILFLNGRGRRMEIKYSIDDLPVQDPPTEEFTASDLTWTKYGSSEHHVDDVALVPYDRVDAFIGGECSNPEHPTRFHIERGRKRERGSLKECKSDEYLLYRLWVLKFSFLCYPASFKFCSFLLHFLFANSLFFFCYLFVWRYWCSFGPENYGEGGSILPSRRYRLNTRNRAARPQSMRGCTCHFAIKRLYARPSIALIIYHERRHVNKSGFICHGPLDRDAIGPGAKKVPYICSEIQQQTMSLIYLGIPEENVLQTHIEGVQRYCDPNTSVNSLASQYVQKLGMIIKRSTHELDLDDQASIRMWVEKNKKSVFFYQDSSETDPFILGIQTEWQLQQMIRFCHQSILACDSSFGISKLKVFKW